MNLAKTTILAGIAALALAGSAYAAGHEFHTMTVKMPGGGMATIEYSGNVAPKVTFGTAPMRAAFFGAASPFVSFDRISAAMNREMNVLLRQADMLAVPLDAPLFNAALNDAPTNGVCMQSVEITQSGNGKPHIVSHSAGQCDHASGLSGTAAQAVPRNGHGMIEAVGKAPAQRRLPMFQEAGYKPE